MKMNAWFCLLWYQTKAQFSAKVLRNESTQETQENTQRQNWTTQRKRNTSRRRRFFFFTQAIRAAASTRVPLE